MKKRDSFLLFILLSLVILIMAFSQQAKEGAKAGLALCESVIIPSLLPVLIIFLLIMKSGARNILTAAGGWIARILFRLPDSAFPAIFLGLLGGYPTGALMTQELFETGEIDEHQAQRMLSFNFCGGLAFLVTAVGTSALNSSRAGYILLASNIISALIMGIGSSFFEKREKDILKSVSFSPGFSDNLTEATESAVRSVLNICAFIILFSAIENIADIPHEITPVIEITNGIYHLENAPLEIYAAMLSFGGFCIHFQLMGIINRLHMNYAVFLFSRFSGAVLSYFIAKGLVLLFPIDAAVFSNSAGRVAEPHSFNMGVSVIMILGMVVLIFDIAGKKKLC